MDEYKKFHNYSKETFIHEIIIFHEGDVSVGDKGLKMFKKFGNIKITPETLKDLPEIELIKIHSFFWKIL